MTDIAIQSAGRTASPAAPHVAGAAIGGVAQTLRLEGAAALVLAAMAYHASGGSWWLFALLFLAPDLSMVGYLRGPSIGGVTYNIGHSYLSPAALGFLGFLLASPAFYGLALIWAAHIGFDRMLGYGLKYSSAFGATHLGFRGKGRA